MNKLFNKIKNNKSFIVPWIVLGISIIIFASGLTYAYFDFVINSENESSLKTVATDFVVSVGATEVNVNNLYPIYDSYSATQAHSFDFSILNESRKMSACYSLELNITAISEALKTTDFKWELVNNNTNAITNGNFKYITANKIDLISQQNLSFLQSVSYTLRIWLSNSLTNSQNEAMNGSLTSKIVIKAIGDACINRTVNNYNYTGNYQIFTTPADGVYQVELWGGTGIYEGRGGYTKGTIYLNEGEKLYVYVGGGFATNGTAFNIGTSSVVDSMDGVTGGGSTDIRYFGNVTPTAEQLEWDNDLGLNSRIMVAAGSGSFASSNITSSGGGLIGYSHASLAVTGGTQTGPGTSDESCEGASFGVASGGFTGGNGYYAGGGGRLRSAGGSSFISGHTGCVAIAFQTDTSEPRVARTGTGDAACETGTTDNLCSIHYSGKKFIDTLMIDGAGYTWTNTKAATVGTNLMPVPTSGYYASGKGSTSASARITRIN